MTAAPGSSILPSRFRSRRLPPCCRQAISSCEHLRGLRVRGRASPSGASSAAARCRSRARPASPRRSSPRSPTPASTCPSCLQPLRGSWFSMSTRAAEPLPPHVVVGGAEAVGADVVPVDHRPVTGVFWGSTPWMCLLVGRKPLPLVLAGARRSAGPGRRPSRRIGSQPRRVLGDVLGVDVEGVEGLRRQRGGLDERLRAVDLAVGEAAVVEQVERVLAVARALRRDRHLAAVDRRVADRPARGRWSGT